MALRDALLFPAGVTLEVLYLDRSETNGEAKLHRFSPNYSIGTIRLLYRPGHYDIIYKPEDLPQASVQAPISTYLHYATEVDQEPARSHDFSDVMTMIPGMSFGNPHQDWISSTGYNGTDFFTGLSNLQPCNQAVSTLPTPVAQPQLPTQLHYLQQPPSQLAQPPTQMPQELVIRTVPNSHSHHTQPSGFQCQLSGPFRPSVWERELQLSPEFAHTVAQNPLQTSIFRK